MIIRCIFLLSILTLVSCVPIYVNRESNTLYVYYQDIITDRETLEAKEEDIVTITETIVAGCDPYEMPSVDDTPTIPIIPEERRSDHRYIANVLIDYIQVLVRHQSNMRDRYLRAYEVHIGSC